MKTGHSMQKSLFILAAFSLIFFAGCVTDQSQVQNHGETTATAKSAEIRGAAHDGEYEVYGTCTWPGYDGPSSIIDRHNVWTIKNGDLNHKKGRFNITGKVKGDTLKVTGTRQLGTETGWYSLYFTGKLTSPAGSELYGSWKNGDYNVTLRKMAQEKLLLILLRGI